MIWPRSHSFGYLEFVLSHSFGLMNSTLNRNYQTKKKQLHATCNKLKNDFKLCPKKVWKPKPNKQRPNLVLPLKTNLVFVDLCKKICIDTGHWAINLTQN